MPGDEPAHLVGQVLDPRRAPKHPPCGIAVEDVQLGVDAGGVAAFDASGRRWTGTGPGAGLQERRREPGHVPEQRRQVGVGQVVAVGVERDRLAEAGGQHVVDPQVRLERVAGLGEVELGRRAARARRASPGPRRAPGGSTPGPGCRRPTRPRRRSARAGRPRAAPGRQRRSRRARPGTGGRAACGSRGTRCAHPPSPRCAWPSARRPRLRRR